MRRSGPENESYTPTINHNSQFHPVAPHIRSVNAPWARKNTEDAVNIIFTLGLFVAKPSFLFHNTCHIFSASSSSALTAKKLFTHSCFLLINTSLSSGRVLSLSGILYHKISLTLRTSFFQNGLTQTEFNCSSLCKVVIQTLFTPLAIFFLFAATPKSHDLTNIISGKHLIHLITKLSVQMPELNSLFQPILVVVSVLATSTSQIIMTCFLYNLFAVSCPK